MRLAVNIEKLFIHAPQNVLSLVVATRKKVHGRLEKGGRQQDHQDSRPCTVSSVRHNGCQWGIRSASAGTYRSRSVRTTCRAELVAYFLGYFSTVQKYTRGRHESDRVPACIRK
jgi:hypothetical protein